MSILDKVKDMLPKRKPANPKENLPKEKEQIYLSAAEYVNKKMDAYMDAFVRIPLPQKSTQEILFMAMLDIAVVSIEYKQSYERCSLLGRLKNILK